MTAKTSTERSRKRRTLLRLRGLVRGDVFAYPEDWPDIRAMEAKLQRIRAASENKEGQQ
jgi:hypothetical protein